MPNAFAKPVQPWLPRLAARNSIAMPTSSRKGRASVRKDKDSETARTLSVEEKAEMAIQWLRDHSSKAKRDGMARFAIPSENALGVSMGDIQALARKLGRDHELAAELWKSGCYEARMLTSYVGEPDKVTAAQMDRWSRDFDNWAICDTVCFALFDRTPHAWSKVEQWSDRTAEFVKRAAFALLWGLTVHDKKAGDDRYLRALPLIERAAIDERNFVKKAVNMALRAIGKRNAALHAAALKVAECLGSSTDPTARWIGKDALRELRSPAVLRRLKPKR